MAETRKGGDFNHGQTPETEQFFSSDPFKVLGIPSDATLDMIRAAKKRLIVKFHPDRYENDPKFKQISEEIFKLIAEAEVKIENLRKNATSLNINSPAQPPEKTSYKPERSESIIEKAVDAIYTYQPSIGVFKCECIIESSSIPKNQLLELLNGADFLIVFIKKLLSILAKTNKDGSVNFEQIDNFVYVYNKFGVKMEKILNNPDVLSAAIGFDISDFGDEYKSGIYINYLERWKKYGVGCDVLKPGFYGDSRDSMKYEFLNKTAENIIVGFDLFGRKKNKLKNFVDRWVQFGWTPPKNIADILEK